jgi:hypothetical protein
MKNHWWNIAPLAAWGLIELARLCYRWLQSANEQLDQTTENAERSANA